MKIKIIGYGNLLRGDDGVAIWVLRELEKIPLPQSVELVDMGTRGMDVLFQLEGTEKIIIIDAVMSGGKSGTVYRMKKEDLEESDLRSISLHDLTWQHGLDLAEKIMGEDFPKEVVVVGIEIGSTQMHIGLTGPVKKSVPLLVNLVRKELGEA